jgi:hypothetical protein
LQRAIFSATTQVELRTTVLVAQAFHTDLLKNDFAKKKLKSRKKRIESLVSGDAVGAACAFYLFVRPDIYGLMRPGRIQPILRTLFSVFHPRQAASHSNHYKVAVRLDR